MGSGVGSAGGVERCVMFNGQDLRIFQWGEAPLSDDGIGKCHLRDVLTHLSTPPAEPTPLPTPPQRLPVTQRILQSVIPSRFLAQSEANTRREQAGGGSGKITVTLMWDTPDDLDLSIECPNNEMIYYGNRTVCGGTLDVDMNAGSVVSEAPVENIFFDVVPREGIYQIFVTNFNCRQAADNGSSYAVIVDLPDTAVQARGNVRHQDGTQAVATFEVTGGGQILTAGHALETQSEQGDAADA